MRWALATIGCAALVAAAVYLGACWAPASEEGGDVYRMLYAHIPLAANTLLAFAVASVASAVYLARKKDAADRLARAAMACGVVMGAAMMATGMIWARMAWGHWWDFRSAKLLFSLLLWLLMVGYFLLRSSRAADVRQRKIAAVYCLIAFLDVPLVYFSSRLAAGDAHPPSIALGHWQMHVALAAGFLAATALHGLLLSVLMRHKTNEQ
ncbi:MAG: cytochrome c biogenesis protein CcsA [Planctomycetes bacterium]|nr:cytochrome c biogenesis protein CcsA [Planctomycetota bacterium]